MSKILLYCQILRTGKESLSHFPSKFSFNLQDIYYSYSRQENKGEKNALSASNGCILVTIPIVQEASTDETPRLIENDRADFLKAAYDFLRNVDIDERDMNLQSHKLPDFESLAHASDSLQNILEQVRFVLFKIIFYFMLSRCLA